MRFNASVGLFQPSPVILDGLQLTFTYPVYYNARRIVDSFQLSHKEGKKINMICDTRDAIQRSSSLSNRPNRFKKMELNLNCDSPDVKCLEDKCRITPVPGNLTLFITMSNTFYPEMLSYNRTQNLAYSVKVHAEVEDDQDKFDSESILAHSTKVDLLFEPHYMKKELEEHQIWPIILAIIIGLLILSCIIFLLFKLKFFERKKPPTMQAQKERSEDLIESSQTLLDNSG